MSEGITTGRRLVLDRRRDQLETDIKSALNFLRGTDLVVMLLKAADSYAGKCCEAAGPGIAAAERERVIAVARAMGATYPVTLDAPPGSEGSAVRTSFPFADYLEDVPAERQPSP